ncbi:UNVERIFIED_CONTAM: hypothetical protein GTU68_017869 [Idotea baltica]|nr:hypothetical protein [Idotea baltica]
MAQVVKRGYAVTEVVERLGISTKSLYPWKTQFAKPSSVRSEVAGQAAEIRRLKRELARVTEERTILEKATAYFARETCSENRVARLASLAGISPAQIGYRRRLGRYGG